MNDATLESIREEMADRLKVFDPTSRSMADMVMDMEHVIHAIWRKEAGASPELRHAASGADLALLDLRKLVEKAKGGDDE